ncbi:MAG: four helix bundle protein [Deltaproteobacteria bacterium]|nr:MAG: four helix bundle protein [Deltaproteobacteria bacterium]
MLAPRKAEPVLAVLAILAAFGRLTQPSRMARLRVAPGGSGRVATVSPALRGACARGSGESSPVDNRDGGGRALSPHSRGVAHMLRIYPIALQIASDVVHAANLIARKDPDLARQLRRASVSVPLNIAEGSRARGRNRNARYSDALGSALETRACYDVATAVTYLPELGDEVRARLNQVIGTLVNLTR